MRTVEALGTTVEEELSDSYTLVYVGQGDELPEDVAAALVKGENPWETVGGERLAEWADDVSWTAACGAVDELAGDIVQRWEREDDADYADLIDGDWPGSDERINAIHTVQDRDASTWFETLVSSYGAVLLRVGIPTMNEDAGLSYTPVTPAAFLDRLGFEHTENNLTVAAEVVDNASPEFSVAIGYALIGVELTELAGLPEKGRVQLHNPHVWLGSPFSGSGWCGDEAFTGTLTVDRRDLRTDKDAFGYSWDQVCGGTDASYFAGSLTLVAEDHGQDDGA
jgi:hypothetical protein